MRLIDRIRTPRATWAPLEMADWVDFFKFQGLDYSVLNQTLAGVPQKEIPPVFYGFSEGAMKANGIVFACIIARLLLFQQARFRTRPKGSSSPSDLSPGPMLLDQPWPLASTADLLALMSMYADLAGNAYVWRDQKTSNALRVARPDWMTIVLGNPRPDGNVGDIDTEVAGYIYKPTGSGDSTPLLPEHVAHFKPLPDPIFHWRGMSWIQPILEETIADNAANVHKRMFFEHGATANTVVSFGAGITPDDFDQWVNKFEEGHEGVLNAYKRLYLAGGADAKVIGADMQQMDFKVVQSHGEARICLAARIPAILVGISEGLDTGNYAVLSQQRRIFADMTARPWWQGACDKLAIVVDVPDGEELWYDESLIPFLQEDQVAAAEIMQAQAAAIASLVMQGFDASAAVDAVRTGDLTRLAHTGLFSVQLHPPGTAFVPTPISPPAPAPGKNGSSKAAAEQRILGGA